MATPMLIPSIPPPEGPSPTPSDTSMSDHVERTENALREGTTPQQRRRAQRSPSRAPLRTGFRDFSNFATVLVGEPESKTRPETKYLIHKELLASASPFFAAALNGTFAEGLDQTVRLPEEKPEIFEWFLQWLYTGTLKTPVPNCGYFVMPTYNHPDINGILQGPDRAIDQRVRAAQAEYDVRTDGDLRNSHGSPKYFLLLDLYALSDRLLTSQLSNHILSTIARLSEVTNSVPTPSDTWILYDSGAIRETSPLRALVLDLFAYKKTDRLLEEHKDEWHPRFLRELCVKLKRPGPEAVERHTFVAWSPDNWNNSRACELCREVVQPNITGGRRCCICHKVICQICLTSPGSWGRFMKGTSGLMDTNGCKPWNGTGMCLRYHEHTEDDREQAPTSRSVQAVASLAGTRLRSRA